MRGAWARAAALAASLFVTRAASAGEIPAAVFLVNLVPSSVGLDTQLRVPIGWPIQIPLGSIDGPRRLVLTPRVVIWAERPLVTFDLRAGYRTNLPIQIGPRTETHAELFAGLGSTLELAPVVRMRSAADD